MKLIIAGSRTLGEDSSVIYVAFQKFSGLIDNVTEIVSGGAKGIDSAGEEYADEQWITVKHFPANWEKFNKSAGMVRNKEMAKYGDALLAIWDGNSRGTLNMINTMKQLNKPVYYMQIETDIFLPEEEDGKE